MRQHETPDWGPLEELLGSDDLCAHFMWMHDIELDDGTTVNAYKHRSTRRYLHLAADGRAFLIEPRHRYREVAPYRAIEVAFETWERYKPTAVERAALRTVLNNARAAGR